MRHSINFFMGSELETLPIEIAKYMIKYGDETSPYFTCYVWDEDKDGSIVIKTVRASVKDSNDVFVSDLKDEFEAVLKEEDTIKTDGQSEYLKDFFTRLHNGILTAINSGIEDELLINIYIPLYYEKCYDGVFRIIDIVKNLDVKYVVDVYGFASDLAHLLTCVDKKDSLKSQFTKLRKQTQETIKKVVTYKNDNPVLSNFVVFQNINSGNRALNLDFEGLSMVVSQLITLGIENYMAIFNDIEDISNNKPITTIGVSFVDFDKFLFVQYLLNRTYLYLMEREGIQQESVDIQKVSYQQHKYIQNHLKVYSEFFKQEVQPLIDDEKSQDEIASIIVPKMVKRFETIEKDMKSCIYDSTMSLPDKLGVLSMLVGEDNEILSGELFSYDYDTLDDLAKDPANFFINDNNKLITRTEDEETGQIIITPGPLIAPVDDSGSVYLPVDELKTLKAKIRETTADIRKKEELLGQLEGCINSNDEKEKRLTKDGFKYKGQTYRLLQSDIEEIPLENNYQPHPVTKKSVDLRPSFTNVKDQGQQGACSAFAMVGIYEYILNKEKKLEYDLSESFLYYNARDLNENTSVEKDTGSTFYHCIKSLETFGICSEEDCPYDPNTFNKKPSETAYENAKNNMVSEALNVDLSVEAIKSAVEDGYPVAVSFKLYDSFNPVNGFICRPSDDEIQKGATDKKNHTHAMVICGYSDYERFFIVRNSWGKGFGVEGYCYIPYSYVGDSQLVNAACIISQLCKTEIKVVGCKSSTVVQFNQSDSAIEYQIIQNLISEMKIDLSEYVNRYIAVNSSYLKLIQDLGTAPKRAEILAQTSERLTREISNLEEKVKELRSSKEEKIEKLKRVKRRPVIISVLTIVVAIALLVALSYADLKYGNTTFMNLSFMKTIMKYGFIILCGIIPLCIVGGIFFYNNYKTHIRNYEEELDDEINKYANDKRLLEEELRAKPIISSIAGHFIDYFLKLRKTMIGVYNALECYLGNLRLWYDSESDNVSSMRVIGKIPFIPLLSKTKLDEFFEKCKDNITDNLHLYDYFNNDTLDFSSKDTAEKAIVEWKCYMKNTTKKRLFDYIDNFSVISYWLNNKKYDYLEGTSSKQHNELISTLTNASKVFLQLNADCNPVSVLFAHSDNDEEKRSFENDYKTYFSADMRPLLAQCSFRDKMTMVQVLKVKLDEIKLMDTNDN